MENTIEELAKNFLEKQEIIVFEGKGDIDTAVDFKNLAEENGHSISRDEAYNILVNLTTD